MAKKSSYSIGELASEFDITARSIRFYEDQGLLMPVRDGQKRIYSRQERVKLKLILRGKRLGLSLAETKDIFDLWDATESGSEKQLKLLLEKIHQRRSALEQQLKDIKMSKLELDNAEARCLQALSALVQKKEVEN